MNDRKIMFVNEKNFLDCYEINLLCSFKYNECNYAIYSKNEKNFDDDNIIYIGKIIIKNNKQYIKNVNNFEYNEIKKIVNKMINFYGDENDD